MSYHGLPLGPLGLPSIPTFTLRLPDHPPPCDLVIQWMRDMPPLPLKLVCKLAPGHDREEKRRQIDRLLDADKRPFATARRAGILAAAEVRPDFGPADTSDALDCLHEYERLRGGMTRPSPMSLAYQEGWAKYPGVSAALSTYERARGMK